MSYTRRNVQDFQTVMDKVLYDNLQDGIDEALNRVAELEKSKVLNATVENKTTKERKV